MNESPEIAPHKITKPIQLLAAWLAGLTIVNASFLTAAGLLHSPTWLSALLTIAAVLNVPVFIASLFLLQTKFRPEMQEDTFYSKYLERKYSQTTVSLQPVDSEQQLSRLAEDIVAKVTAGLPNKEEQVIRLLKESEVSQMAERFQNSRTLSEIHLFFPDWRLFHERWCESPQFKEEIATLSTAGLILIPDGVVANAQLTSLGETVAQKLEKAGKLWNQRFENKTRHKSDLQDLRDANKRVQCTR